ncbi:hypothetical protein PUR61_11980 [Streptomyces sp. BE20]|uniref:hypothetical protein n=1 Tax=Streptomyces sp. BE20 TaxID=3002525 RepID=UPI002E772DCD|nr:hypothetical protein [Streptomyces sp. BE20]MEE1822906.1 hypothetical protein [Streptomyces sp. BE20]
MTDNKPVNPSEVPVFTGNLALLDANVKAISTSGPAISTATGNVHTSFGGLRAFYQAPEAEQLFATTKPVQDLGLKLSTDLCTIAGALGTYSRDAAPIVKKLQDLKHEAETFRNKANSDDKWREDGDLVDENNDRRNEIAEVWTQFQAVERAAHAKIVALVGGSPLKVNDGSNGKDMYGYDAEALKQSKTLPWGEAVEESIPWWQVWEHAWEFGKGVIVDGVWGTLVGLGTLVGFQGWDAAGQAWTGLAKLATGLAITAIPGVGPLFLAVPDDKLPSWLRDSRTAMKETGKALLAWDQWGSNPSRAAGAVTFNVLTTVFTGGAGGAASGAGKAGAAAKAISLAGKAGRVIDPMTYLFKGAGAGFTKIGDVMTSLKGLGKFEVPTINIDKAVALPEGALKLPDGTIRIPKNVAVPDGAFKVGDDTVKFPKNTTTLPTGTVKLPVDGPPRFMDPKGNIYDAGGNITQRVDEAKPDIVDRPAKDHAPLKTETPVKVDTRELVGAGARGGNDGIRLTSDVSGPVNVADHVPTGRVNPDNFPTGRVNPADNFPTGRVNAGDNLPGGHAGHGPSNDLNAPRGGSGDSPVTPGTHGTHGGDGPTTGGSHGTDGPGGGGSHGNDTPGTGGSHGNDTPGGGGSHGNDGPGGGGSHGNNTPGTGPAGTADNAAGAGDNAATPRQPVPRPATMLDGPNPYGERGRLDKGQIEEIQVYRANEEPGYFEDHYNILGRRLSGKPIDESGFPPPQLTKLSEDGPWIRAKDSPEAPDPHYLDIDEVPLGADKVTDPVRLKILDDLALKQQNAIKWDNLVTDWMNRTGHPDAQGVYRASHTEMGTAAEAFGEGAAKYHFVAEHYKGFESETLLGPKSGSDQFDQVWVHEDGRVLVIEAKSGPKTELGKRDLPSPSGMPGVKGQAVSQGSREYFLDILREMTKRGETDLVEKIEKALDTPGKLDYVVVKGDYNTGSYNGLLYQRFDISKGTLP